MHAAKFPYLVSYGVIQLLSLPHFLDKKKVLKIVQSLICQYAKANITFFQLRDGLLVPENGVKTDSIFATFLAGFFDLFAQIIEYEPMLQIFHIHFETSLTRTKAYRRRSELAVLLLKGEKEIEPVHTVYDPKEKSFANVFQRRRLINLSFLINYVPSFEKLFQFCVSEQSVLFARIE